MPTLRKFIMESLPSLSTNTLNAASLDAQKLRVQRMRDLSTGRTEQARGIEQGVRSAYPDATISNEMGPGETRPLSDAAARRVRNAVGRRRTFLPSFPGSRVAATKNTLLRHLNVPAGPKTSLTHGNAVRNAMQSRFNNSL